jgi:hypothetical protein
MRTRPATGSVGGVGIRGLEPTAQCEEAWYTGPSPSPVPQRIQNTTCKHTANLWWDSCPSPGFLNPAQAPHQDNKYICKQTGGPGGGRKCMWYWGGGGRKGWPPRSHFPSLVSYRLDSSPCKPVGPSPWTQRALAKGGGSTQPLLVLAPFASSQQRELRGRDTPAEGQLLGFWVLALCILESSLTIPRLQSNRLRGVSPDPSACSMLGDWEKYGPEQQDQPGNLL